MQNPITTKQQDHNQTVNPKSTEVIADLKLDQTSEIIRTNVDALVCLASIHGQLLAKKQLGLATSGENQQILKFDLLKKEGLSNLADVISNSTLFSIHSLEERLSEITTKNKNEILKSYLESLNQSPKSKTPNDYYSGLTNIADKALKSIPKAIEASLVVGVTLVKFTADVATSPFTWENPFKTTSEFTANYLLASQKFFNKNVPGGSILGSEQEFANNSSDFGLVFISLNPFSHLANSSINPVMEAIDYSYNEWQRNNYNQQNKSDLSYSEFVVLQEIDEDLKNKKRIFQGCEIAATVALMLASGGSAAPSIFSSAGVSSLATRSISMLKVPAAMAGANAFAGELMQWDEKNSQGQTSGFNVERFFDSLIAGTAHNLLFVGGLNLGMNTAIGLRSGVWFAGKEGRLISKLNSLKPQEAKVVYDNFQRVLTQTSSFAKVVDVIDAFSDLGESLKNYEILENPSSLLENPSEALNYLERNWKKGLGATITAGVAIKDASDFSGSEADVATNISRNALSNDNSPRDTSLHALKVNRNLIVEESLSSEVKLAPRRASQAIQLQAEGELYQGVISGSGKNISTSSRPDPGRYVYLDNPLDVAKAYEEILFRRIQILNKKFPQDQRKTDEELLTQAREESFGVVSFFDSEQDLVVSARISNAIGDEFTSLRVGQTSNLVHEEVHKLNLPYKEQYQRDAIFRPGVPGDKGDEIEAFKAQRDYIISRNKIIAEAGGTLRSSFFINENNELIIEPSADPKISNYHDIERYIASAYPNLKVGEYRLENLSPAKHATEMSKEEIAAVLETHASLIAEAQILLAQNKTLELVKKIKASKIGNATILLHSDEFLSAVRTYSLKLCRDLLLDPNLTIEKRQRGNEQLQPLFEILGFDLTQVKEISTKVLVDDMLTLEPNNRTALFERLALYIHNQYLLVSSERFKTKQRELLDRCRRGNFDFDLNQICLEEYENANNILDTLFIIYSGLLVSGESTDASRLRDKIQIFLSAENTTVLITKHFERHSDLVTTALLAGTIRRDPLREARQLRQTPTGQSIIGTAIANQIETNNDLQKRYETLTLNMCLQLVDAERLSIVRRFLSASAKGNDPFFKLLNKIIEADQNLQFTKEELSYFKKQGLGLIISLCGYLFLLGERSKLRNFMTQFYIGREYLQNIMLQLYFNYARYSLDVDIFAKLINDLEIGEHVLGIFQNVTMKHPLLRNFGEICRLRITPTPKRAIKDLKFDTVSVLSPLLVLQDSPPPSLDYTSQFSKLVGDFANACLNTTLSFENALVLDSPKHPEIETDLFFFLHNLSTANRTLGNVILINSLPQVYYTDRADFAVSGLNILRLGEKVVEVFLKVDIKKWAEVSEVSQNDKRRTAMARIALLNQMILLIAKKYKLDLNSLHLKTEQLEQEVSDLLEYLPPIGLWSETSRNLWQRLDQEIKEIEQAESQRLADIERKRSEKREKRAAQQAHEQKSSPKLPKPRTNPPKITEPTLSPEQIVERDLAEFNKAKLAIKQHSIGDETFPEWMSAFGLFQQFFSLRTKKSAQETFQEFFGQFKIKFKGAEISDQDTSDYEMSLDSIYYLLMLTLDEGERSKFSETEVSQVWGFLEFIASNDSITTLWEEAVSLYDLFEERASFATLSSIALANKFRSKRPN